MDWKPWLARWSEEWLSTEKEPDPAVARERWLGFEPASEAAVASLERRLQRRLPPSYREFLLTTDGWRNAGEFVWRLRDTSDVDLLRVLEPFWEEAWEWVVEDTPLDNCFTRGVLISRDADAGILFLDPGDVDENGEWAAYSLFSWRAEPPVRFASFTALMDELYAEFHRMRQPAGETRDHWDAETERARLLALGGHVDEAEAVLAKAENSGRTRATVLRAQLLLMLDRHYEAGMLIGRLLRPGSPDFLRDPLFTEEFLPWLRFQDALPHHNSILRAALIGEQPDLRRALAEDEARTEPPTFGPPEFDARVRQALNGDPARLWAAVHAALPHWRPRTDDHIAPIGLLAHPVLARAFTADQGRALLSRARS
ncbi:SMI1/KNR4 family protein [Amycolatopsis sp. 195334CR]|uniref:SMI1/KNR4 family protein n=1 Tax=Amycolatopsis sp. 195334CR TaxID=2814588 RepID=UPI001A8CC855|nr:SMI1/KNR4 family protein [Amycolatopsis sp. 195334CR]MBN6042129.1 SMI1/KNR4 family protein [Amycolatopsis sp. 195334CR]